MIGTNGQMGLVEQDMIYQTCGHLSEGQRQMLATEITVVVEQQQ